MCKFTELTSRMAEFRPILAIMNANKGELHFVFMVFLISHVHNLVIARQNPKFF